MSNGRVHALDLQVAAPTRDQIIPNVLPSPHSTARLLPCDADQASLHTE